MVWIALQMGLFIARLLLEKELEHRAKQPVAWGNCSKCGTRMVSKGWYARQMETLVGKIGWKRRVGRCPKKCAQSLSIPLDEAIGIKPHQSSSEELMRLGCLLSVVMPYELASWKHLPQLLHRRVVAVLGNIDAFIPRLRLEARRQSFEAAPQVIWLSDGGRGFWRVYRTCFAHCAIAVLDFYHAAGHLWRATTALFDDPLSSSARAWFTRWRHQLRHGHHLHVLTTLTSLINSDILTGKSLLTLRQVQAYFQRHHRHIRYQQFEQQQIPLSSGMIRPLA